MTSKQIAVIVEETLKRSNKEKKTSFLNAILIAIIPIFIFSALGSYMGGKLLDKEQTINIKNNKDLIDVNKSFQKTMNDKIDKISDGQFKLSGRLYFIEGKMNIVSNRSGNVSN